MHEHDEHHPTHSELRDAQGNMQMDDINIPLVSVSVAFFGVLLAVTIISLQAWFYNEQTALRQANMLPRDFAGTEQLKGTELGILWKMHHVELYDPEKAPVRAAAATTGPATTTAPSAVNPPASAPKVKRMTIDQAIASIVKDGY